MHKVKKKKKKELHQVTFSDYQEKKKESILLQRKCENTRTLRRLCLPQGREQVYKRLVAAMDPDVRPRQSVRAFGQRLPAHLAHHHQAVRSRGRGSVTSNPGPFGRTFN